jgi:hypothetical protein
MFAIIYRFLKLAWRYRRFVALAATVLAGFLERNRSKLPGPLQRLDLTKVPGVATTPKAQSSKK